MAKLALKAPVMEASFEISEKSPLVLYDCLIPKIKEHEYEVYLKCHACKEKRQLLGIIDPTVQAKQLTVQQQYWQMYSLQQDNEELVRFNTQLQQEAEIVQWYISVFEDGQDTREILELYSKLKVKHRKLIKKHEDMLSKSSSDIKSLTKELAAVKKNLKK